jgi:hypothetical protein
MKLRVLLGILILANGLYFAWAQGWMRAYGFAPVQQSEPQRMAQQIRPEAVHILTPDELKKAEAQAQADLAPKECLQAGPFDEAQTSVLRKALERLPSGSWQLDVVAQPARWIVYMGKYANAEMLAKKRAELANMNLKIEALNNPALEIGISLGGFDSSDAASAELARLNQRGIHTARVVQERAAASMAILKLPSVTEAFKARLDEIKPELAGKTLKKCG